jgi:type IV secretion system protein VirB1
MGDTMIGAALLACALNVAPATLAAVIQVESAGNPLALHVNGLLGPQPDPTTLGDAIDLAERYIRLGYSVDFGLMQVNSRNLAALGYSIAQALDPCTNIQGGARILTADYAAAVQSRGEGQAALQAALSAYNTGDFDRGFGNGYVARYFPRSGAPARPARVRHAAVPRAARPNPYTADTQIYLREATNIHVD